MSKRKTDSLIELNPTKDIETDKDNDNIDESKGGCCSWKKLILIAIGLLVILGLAGFLVWWFALRKEDEKPVVPANPFVVKASYKSERNYTLLLWNARKRETGAAGDVMKAAPKNLEAEYLRVEVAAMHDHHFNLKIFDANRTRWEPHYLFDSHVGSSAIPKVVDVSTFINMFQHYSLADLNFTFEPNVFGWTLWGAQTQRMERPVVSSVKRVLEYKDKYLEFEVEVPCTRMFGLPQAANSVTLEPGTYTLWNRYKAESGGAEEGLGGIDFMLCQVKGNKFLGLFMDNSNAHSVRISKGAHEDTMVVNYKLTGGIVDFSVFHVGDATAISRLYHEYIGKPATPPLWALGVQQSRANYGTLDILREVVLSYREHNLPLDALWMDQRLMQDYKTYTVDEARYPKLQDQIQIWKQQGLFFVQSVLPHVKQAEYFMYQQAMMKKAYIQNASNPGQPVVTRGVDTGNCIFLDQLSKDGWNITAQGHQHLYNVSFFDGLWFRQDAPHTLCHGTCSPPAFSSLATHDPHEYDDLPYEPVPLANYTLPLTGYHNLAGVSGNVSELMKHFNVHNMFSLLLVKTAAEVGKLDEYDFKMLLTASVSDPRLGQYATLWRGNVPSDWSALVTIITETVGYNIAGLPSVGFPICGFAGVPENMHELCQRWYQLGTYLPTFRLYHDGHQQIDPYQLDKLPGVRQALVARYAILRFLYTKLVEAELFGGPVWEPLAFSFPDEAETYNATVLQQTFIIGKTLYVAPVLKPMKEEPLKVYLPNWHWYSMKNWSLVAQYDPKRSSGGYRDFPTSYEYSNVFVKGGSIIPLQDGVVNNTRDLSKKSITLVVAPDHEGKARGTMVVARDLEFEFEKKLYNHYSFTYSDGMFRVNLIEGFANPIDYDSEFLSEVWVLNYPCDNVHHAYVMDINLVYDPLAVACDQNSKVLKLTVSEKLHILLKNVESIGFGDASTQDMSRYKVNITNIVYDNERKQVTAQLRATAQSVVEEYVFMCKMIFDSVMYYSVERASEQWKVPDAIDRTIIEKPNSQLSLDNFRLELPPENSLFEFTIKNPKDTKATIVSSHDLPFVYPLSASLVSYFMHLSAFINCDDSSMHYDNLLGP